MLKNNTRNNTVKSHERCEIIFIKFGNETQASQTQLHCYDMIIKIIFTCSH